MTFATVSQALSQGYAISKVIKSVLQMNTPLAKAIKEALKQGYNEDQIGEYLEKGKNASYSQKNQMLKGMTEEEKARGIAYRQSKSEKNIGNILKTAAMAAPVAAAGAVAGPMIGSALGRMAPTAMNALQRAAPQLMGAGAIPGGAQALAQTGVLQQNQSLNQATQTPQTQQTIEGIQQNPQQPPSNLGNANIPQPTNIEQPKEKSNNLEKLWLGFEKGRDKGFDFESDAFLKIAKRMKSTGEIKSREDFERFFNLFDQKKKEGKDLPTALKESSIEYDNQKLAPKEQEEQKVPDLGQMAKGMTDNLYNGLFESLKKGSTKFAGIEDPLLKRAKEPFEKGLIKSPEDLRKFANEAKTERPKIEKASIVSSPQGVGEVKEIRNGQALIDVDGKLHKVKEEELEQSPIPEKDLAELHDELIKGIESETGEDVSRMVQWAGYNPETNTLQFLPHTGKLYKYANISPEDAALLTDILSVRKTSGSNFIGAWKAGSKSPIGAALSKLIRKLQSERGGKGNEYEETHEPIYSAYEPAIEAKKRKKKKT